MLAYAGGAIATVSVLAAYAIEVGQWIRGEKPDHCSPLDDLAQ
jgi:hypothetical protein